MIYIFTHLECYILHFGFFSFVLIEFKISSNHNFVSFFNSFCFRNVKIYCDNQDQKKKSRVRQNGFNIQLWCLSFFCFEIELVCDVVRIWIIKLNSSCILLHKEKTKYVSIISSLEIHKLISNLFINWKSVLSRNYIGIRSSCWHVVILLWLKGKLPAAISTQVITINRERNGWLTWNRSTCCLT